MHLPLLLSSCLLLALINLASSQKQPTDGFGIASLKTNEMRQIVGPSPYAVILRDLGSNISRSDLFYGFFHDKKGVDHVYQFNSMKSLTSGRADVIWLFDESKQCVANSAVIYNSVLFCRLWSNKFDEYNNPSMSSRAIKPVTIARFNLGGVPTTPICDPNNPAPHAKAAILLNSVDVFERLPISATNTVNFLDKYDLKIDGPQNIQLERPNMNVRFHVDESGMWLLIPFQQSETRNPYFRRLRIDPLTLATRQVSFPSDGVLDTSPMIMMNYGIGVVVSGLYYGIGRTGEGVAWFRQRPTREQFSADAGPFSQQRDGGFLLLGNPTSGEYVSTIQFNPIFNEISFTVRDLQKPLGEQYRHVIVTVVRKS